MLVPAILVAVLAPARATPAVALFCPSGNTGVVAREVFGSSHQGRRTKSIEFDCSSGDGSKTTVVFGVVITCIVALSLVPAVVVTFLLYRLVPEFRPPARRTDA